MLERARQRLQGRAEVALRSADLNDPLFDVGRADFVTSGLAIHHLSDRRKQSLLEEVFEVLKPGGVFANLDLFRSPTEADHRKFREEIGRTQDDPGDQLCFLAEELRWLADAGFDPVDCPFKWRELGLLVGRKPG